MKFIEAIKYIGMGKVVYLKSNSLNLPVTIITIPENSISYEYNVDLSNFN